MAKGSRDEHLLDNPVWHSLHGPLSGFVAPSSTADPNAGMKRDLIQFDPSVNIFSAVDEIDDTKWNRIAELVGVEGFCALFRDVIPASPAGWEEHFRGTCLQMVAEDLPGSSGLAVVRLGTGDAADMLALTELTEPGPFMSRTVELGRYVGIRRDGRLIAMAGERFRLPGFVEISAVCTHPDVRGEGLAGELTLNVAQSIRAGGDEAFLHVLETNENAARLYQKLGFVVRRSVDVVFAQWHGPDWQPTESES
jgi:predicted GNAT family acetyltransferase